MMTPEERYRRDPMFYKLVNMIRGFIEKMELTPTEIREAAVLACYKYEMGLGYLPKSEKGIARVEAERDEWKRIAEACMKENENRGIHIIGIDSKPTGF